MFGHKDGLTPGFTHRVLYIAGVIAVGALLIKLTPLWLLVFGAIVIAAVLRVMATPLIRYCKLNETVSVLVALLTVIAVFALTFYLFGREIVDQVRRLILILPTAWESLQAQLDGSAIDPYIDEQVAKLGEQASGFVSRIPGIAGNILSSFASLIVVVVGGVFLAARPTFYREGVVVLVPERYRDNVREGLNDSGEALRMWFWGQFLSMVIVGSLTGIGLSILGVPSALALGLIAGLAQFIPIVGPVIAALPGLIIAAASGGHTFVWALIVYTGVSQLEANLITPMVQNQIASIPAVLTLFAIMGFAILLGPLGVALAMPLTVVIYTLVRKHMIRSGSLKPKPPRRLFKRRAKAS